jgi:hypothetical protein
MSLSSSRRRQPPQGASASSHGWSPAQRGGNPWILAARSPKAPQGRPPLPGLEDLRGPAISATHSRDTTPARLRAAGTTALAWCRVAGRQCETVALRAGLLDLPVHPVRTRRALSAAALVYVLCLSACLIAWWVIVRSVLRMPAAG